MTKYKGRRALVFIYEDAPAVREVRAEPDTDDALLALYEHASAVHEDAWVLYAGRGLPAWWRLVHEIRAEAFGDGTHDRVTWPEYDAALRVAGLTTAPVSYEAEGWRVVKRGPRAGRLVRVTERHRTGRLVQTLPDRTVHYPEAFTTEPEAASLRTGDGVQIITTIDPIQVS